MAELFEVRRTSKVTGMVELMVLEAALYSLRHLYRDSEKLENDLRSGASISTPSATFEIIEKEEL